MSDVMIAIVAALCGFAAGVAVDRTVARQAPEPRVAGRSRRAARAALFTASGGAFGIIAFLSARTAGFGMAAPGELPVAFTLSTSALLLVAATSIALTVIDVRTHRLPNAIVLPALGATTALLAASCLFGAPWSAFVRAVTAGIVLFLFFAALRFVGRGAMGGGDVKFAALVGLVLGWGGWSAVLAGVLAAFLLGGLVGLALILARRADRTTRIPFGPFLAAGTWVGTIAEGATL